MGARSHRFSKFTVSLALLFVAVLAVSGMWIPLVSSITGPPWEGRLLGPPASADTPFMDDVWAWENRDLAEKAR